MSTEFWSNWGYKQPPNLPEPAYPYQSSQHDATYLGRGLNCEDAQAPTESASLNIATTSEVSEVYLPQPCIQSVTVLYRPRTARAQSLYLRDLMHPIQFVNKTSGTVGITIQDLLDGKTGDILVGSELLVECFVQNKLTLRLNWRGCKPWNDQFWTRTYSQDPKLITLGKLAERIAAAVRKFKQNFKIADDSAGMLAFSYPSAVELRQVVLIGFIHVSQGSWQPDLRVLV